MRYLSAIALLLLAHTISAQTLFSRVCTQYDTATYADAFLGYCSPVQQLADGSFLTMNMRGQSGWGAESINYFNFQVIKTDTAFRPQYIAGNAPYLTLALADGTIGSIGNENDDTSASGLSFIKRDLDGNYISAKIIHSDWSHFFVHNACTLPAGFRIMTDLSSIPDTAGSITSAPLLIDLDNNGYVLSADSIHIAGFVADNIWPYRLESDAAGNSMVFIHTWYSSRTSIISKLMPDKTIVWTNELDCTRDLDPFTSVQLPDGSVILGNNYLAIGDSSRSLLMKFSPSGALLWQKISNLHSGISSMKLLPNGNILLVNGLNGTDFGWWIPHGGKMITEIDPSGDIIWSRSFKRPITGAMYTALGAPFIKSANEWNFIANTCYPYMVTLFNTDSNGHSICGQDTLSITFTDTSVISVTPSVMTLSHVPAVYSVHTTGYTGTTPQTYNDGCIYDYSAPPLSVSTTSPATPATTIQLYPNPAFDNIHITLSTGETINDISIYDASGRLCLHTQPRNNDPISISTLPQGYYTIKLTTTTNTLYYHKLSIIH